jgi:hypothetical protein
MPPLAHPAVSLNVASKHNFLASGDKTTRKRCGQALLAASAAPAASIPQPPQGCAVGQKTRRYQGSASNGLDDVLRRPAHVVAATRLADLSRDAPNAKASLLVLDDLPAGRGATADGADAKSLP